MVQRELDAAFINRIANSAAVRPFVDYRGVAEPLDLSAAVGTATRTGVIWLSNGEDALAAFPQTGDRDWQAHLFFDATCRGRRALAVAREMLDWMQPFADLIWGAAPLHHRAVRWFARELGFEHVGDDEYQAEGRVAIYAKRMA